MKVQATSRKKVTIELGADEVDALLREFNKLFDAAERERSQGGFFPRMVELAELDGHLMAVKKLMKEA